MEWLVRTDTFSPLFFPNFYVLSVFSNCWFSSPPSVFLSAPVCVRLPCLLFFFFVRPPVLRELFWVFSCWFSAPLYVFPVSSFSYFWVSPLLLVLPFFSPPLCFMFVVFPVSPVQYLPYFLLFLFSSSSPRFCSFFSNSLL